MKYIEFIAVLAILGISIYQTIKIHFMAREIEDLTVEVEETKGIMASAKVLIEGFAEALRKAGQDPVKLKELQTSLDAGSTDLANAIAANPLPGENPEPTPEG